MTRITAACLPAVLLVTTTAIDAVEWSAVKQGIQLRYPEVEIITTQQLAAWWSQADSVQPVLFDVRRDDEYSVSHLAGAVRALTVEAALTVLAEASLDTPIVTYCSVGYRSGGLADKLRLRGYSRVRNLEGSLFQWANEGRNLVDADGATRFVHPYGPPWSWLLDENRRWQEPAEPSE
ncbi:MAG: rhodanese-like domain-containing protein [Candidatus Latescibacteria bacterium]|nr:rhodanese-like domain-containing protein [Candidatus Latescibacterota bacterium]MDP7447936.1 rhodanese-like domain-containing protein [Candidatus Latescibacterota bacterium]HJP30147.1 rhodanese-like domain-containing protein [Candidatus Latescibacterota bacterium]